MKEERVRVFTWVLGAELLGRMDRLIWPSERERERENKKKYNDRMRFDMMKHTNSSCRWKCWRWKRNRSL